MRKSRLLLLRLLLAGLYGLLSSTARGDNLLAAHDPKAPGFNKNCISCHSGLDQAKSLDGKTPQVHATHLKSKFLTFGCTTCHVFTDLRERSAAGLRSQVERALCGKCHSPFSSVMDKSFRDQSCVACHPDWKTLAMAKTGYIKLSAVTEKDCLTCHGAKAWYFEPKQGGAE